MVKARVKKLWKLIVKKVASQPSLIHNLFLLQLAYDMPLVVTLVQAVAYGPFSIPILHNSKIYDPATTI